MTTQRDLLRECRKTRLELREYYYNFAQKKWVSQRAEELHKQLTLCIGSLYADASKRHRPATTEEVNNWFAKNSEKAINLLNIAEERLR